MCTTPAFALVGVARAPRSKIIDVRKLFFVVAMLATPSHAATITYDFATRIDVAVANVSDSPCSPCRRATYCMER